MESPFLIRLQPRDLQLYLKRDPAQLFYFEFCEKFKNSCEHLRTAYSDLVNIWKMIFSPGSPLAPSIPFEPSNPGCPFAPGEPCDPVSPLAPLIPSIPAAPASPFGPGGPCEPFAPS